MAKILLVWGERLQRASDGVTEVIDVKKAGVYPLVMDGIIDIDDIDEILRNGYKVVEVGDITL